MLSRLSNNIATSVMPFYLTSVLHVGGVSNAEGAYHNTPWEIAIIPLCLYLGSTVMSFMTEKIAGNITRKKQYIAGVAFTVIAGVPMFFLKNGQEFSMIPLALVYGVGFSLTLNNSMRFVAAFVGENGKYGGFVWGFISLFDKFSSGIAIFLLMNLGDLNSEEYVRAAFAGLPLVASLGGGMALLCIRELMEFTLRNKCN